jgi:hypothetical protein
MPLATIVGMCLLLPWTYATIAPSMAAVMVSQSQDKPPADSSSQSPPSPPQSNQQKASDQSTAPPGAKTGFPPCPENSKSGSSAKSDCKTTKPADAKPKKHHRASKSDAPPATPGKTDSQTNVVKNGSTTDPDINLAPSMSPEQASQQREKTAQLLASSDANLKGILVRQLDANQQETVKQIQSYIDQAKKATEDGDVQRAYNLAVKANLLSAELAKH